MQNSGNGYTIMKYIFLRNAAGENKEGMEDYVLIFT